MRKYQIFLDNPDVTTSVYNQKQRTIREINSKKYKKNSKQLENTLNDFFYNKKGKTYNKYYDKAMNLAQQEFQKRYSNYNFELDTNKLTAKYNNNNMNFINKKDSVSFKLEKAQKIAKELETLIAQGAAGKREEYWNSVIKKINEAKNLSNEDVKNINDIVASIKFGNKTVYGDAFEFALAGLSALMEKKVEEAPEELFYKKLQGGDRSSTRINISGLTKTEKKLLNIQNTIELGGGDVLEYKNSTQDKIDVSLTLNNTEYNISAKSYYDISKPIHILGGTALTIPVLNLSNTDFVSHYFTELYNDRGNLNMIHDALKLNILLLSLTGLSSSSKVADTFVVNDKKRSKVIVKNMNEIINAFVQNSEYINKYLYITKDSNDIPDKKVREIFQKSDKPKYSTSTIINELHKQKLQVSIKGNILNQI